MKGVTDGVNGFNMLSSFCRHACLKYIRLRKLKRTHPEVDRRSISYLAGARLLRYVGITAETWYLALSSFKRNGCYCTPSWHPTPTSSMGELSVGCRYERCVGYPVDL